MPKVRPLTSVLLLCLSLQAEERVRFHQYVAGQKLGGTEVRTSKTPAGDLSESREWLKLSRLGLEISQELRQTALRKPDGSLHFTWRVQLSAEPFEGEADWSPQAPGVLRLRPKGGAPRELAVPAGTVLWPGDAEARMREAARRGLPVRIPSFSFPTQQWSDLDLRAPKPAPLPGYADAVRFEGTDAQGPARMDVELWFSPSKGELRHRSTFSGLEMLSQREDLPEPGAPATTSFFDASLKTLPEHPFLPWLSEVTVRWSGSGLPALPEDAQQRSLAPSRYQLRRAAAPTAEEAADPPVKGRPSPEEAPFLAATPLVQFQDPAFDGLLHRLRPAPGSSRWALAQRVTAFVYDWIEQKDYAVGFASALEVAHTPKGDCTEHGVLAVALLRKLGVPARGVVGWVALARTLGLHFWVEVKLKDRWVPVDPTFDQAPASAFRLKLGTTDLADLGTLGWDTAGQAFGKGTWAPDGAFAQPPQVLGDRLHLPQAGTLRFPGGAWTLRQDAPCLNGRWLVKATLRPTPALTREAEAVASAGGRGWLERDTGRLHLEVAEGRWATVEGLREGDATPLLEGLRFSPGKP